MVWVDLHCHSDLSDGYYPPPVVVDRLAEAGVTYAALTDHQTAGGVVPFHTAAAYHGIVDIVGAEIHATFDGAEIHLLAYGFDPASPALEFGSAALEFGSAALRGVLDAVAPVADAIAAVHAAGGLVFLAHPLETGWIGERLDENVAALAQLGLDGIEAFYKPYPLDVQDRLASLADRLALLTCGGSDYHGSGNGGAPDPGVAIPVARWKRFREALGDHARNGEHVPADPAPPEDDAPHPAPARINWRWLSLRIVLPSLLVIGVFVTLLFVYLIPTVEERLIDRKREMTAELTNSAWSILNEYHREVQAGEIPLEDAQHAAIEQIRNLRYGREGKDYFWITDMHPRMLMHPYRTDLEGSDLTDFTDPEGVRPFVAFVETVRDRDAGFVTYVWQWQDDPDRLAAKESYVREFAPWGWIIGTGLYADDVEREIAAITGQMVDASFIVTAVATALLLMVAYQSLKIERQRSQAERELRRSHERYRALVESSASGTLLLLDGRCTYANQTLLEMLGYAASELAFLDLADILVLRGGDGANGPHPSQDADAAESLARILRGEEVRDPFEARLRTKAGEIIPVLLSSTAVYFSGRQGMILSVQDLTRHRAVQSEAERERLLSQLQTSFLFLTEPVHDAMGAPLSSTLDTPIAQVVRQMSRRGVDAVVITGGGGRPVGVVTDRDLRERVVATGLETHHPVSRIMSAPVVTIEARAPVFEAFLLEREHGVRHLAVTDEGGELVGIIQSSRALQPDQYALVVFIQQIRRAQTVEALADGYARLPALVSSLVEAGALPRNICAVTTAVSDAIARRVIALALARFGPAPVSFAFVALGSEARAEQTLATDQDNALIFADPDADQADAVADYFLRLGTWICDSLDQVGYRHCDGGIMAKNPQWNQPLAQWKRYVDTWMNEPDAQALSHAKVFFDHRCVYGDEALVEAWWAHITEMLAARPAFLSHMARNILQYKPPVDLLGRIVTGASGEGAHTFDIKSAMLPIVNFARLYALQHHVAEANTYDRLEQLTALDVVQAATTREITEAYTHLMQLRFRHQVARLKAAQPPDNAIDPSTLSQIDLGILKLTFSQISTIQKKVSFDFRGAT